MYRDKRLLDKANVENVRRCRAAVQASADKIYEVFAKRKIPNPPDYQALRHVCDLNAVCGDQELKHLFTF